MPAEPTASLKDRAESDLKFIRDAMGGSAARQALFPPLLGFGAGHVATGLIVARRHGG